MGGVAPARQQEMAFQQRARRAKFAQNIVFAHRGTRNQSVNIRPETLPGGAVRFVARTGRPVRGTSESMGREKPPRSA
jgi:hypothetical protein